MYQKLLVVLIFVFTYSNTPAQRSFLVAGHAYGSHAGTNLGLHPPFIDKMNELNDSSSFALFLTGDIVNHSTTESWNQVLGELENFQIPFYFVMGNHDNNAPGYKVFDELYGGSYYSFRKNEDVFIVLNSTLKDRSISSDQMDFVDQVFNEQKDSCKRVFMFFHEVLWNSGDRYKYLLSNSRSRYSNMKKYSNFWTEFFPKLKATQNEIYVFSGDVAGNADAIPAFFEQIENVTLVASGMGEVAEENFLKVNMTADSVWFELIGLRDEVELKKLGYYSIPNKPDSIFGKPDLAGDLSVETYWIEPIWNASEYEWNLEGEMVATESENQIDITFDSTFQQGTLSVRSLHSGFGVSDWERLTILRGEDESTEINQLNNQVDAYWFLSGGDLVIRSKDAIKEILIFDVNGQQVHCSSTDNRRVMEMKISKLNVVERNYILILKTTSGRSVSKINF